MLACRGERALLAAYLPDALSFRHHFDWWMLGLVSGLACAALPAYLEGNARKATEIILAARRHWHRILVMMCFACWLLQYFHVCRGPSLVYRRTPRNQELLLSCEKLKGLYIPTPFLFTGWLHTIWMFLAYCPPDVGLQRQILPTQDGGHLTVDWAQPTAGSKFEAEAPITIVVPGVAGSGRKTTWRGVMYYCSAVGLPSVCLSWRGYDGTELAYPFASHLGFIDDIDVLVDEIEQRWPGRPIVGIGISMGGHALARYIGVKGTECRLRAAVCISAGYSIVDGFRVLATQPISNSILNSRFQDVVRHHKVLFEKLSFPKLNVTKLLTSKTILDFDREFTVKLCGESLVIVTPC